MARTSRPQTQVQTGLDKYGLQGSYASLQDHEQQVANRLCGGNQENAAVSQPPIPRTNSGGAAEEAGEG